MFLDQIWWQSVPRFHDSHGHLTSVSWCSQTEETEGTPQQHEGR